MIRKIFGLPIRKAWFSKCSPEMTVVRHRAPRKELALLRHYSLLMRLIILQTFHPIMPSLTLFLIPSLAQKFQAYQGLNSPIIGVGDGRQFLMYAGGNLSSPVSRPAIIDHVCFSVSETLFRL